MFSTVHHSGKIHSTVVARKELRQNVVPLLMQLHGFIRKAGNSSSNYSVKVNVVSLFFTGTMYLNVNSVILPHKSQPNISAILVYLYLLTVS